MISYELAKQLKDAGFKQGEEKPGSGYYEGKYIQDVQGAGMLSVYIPTLSELIKACEKTDGWFELKNQPLKSAKVWEAWINHGITREPDIAQGSTPEEAAVKLLIKLNQHSKSLQ